MRLIDADTLCRDLSELATLRSGSPVTKGLIQAMYIVRDASTIEAKPVRHGRWVYDDYWNRRCSECHERLPFFHCYSDEPNSDRDEEWDEEIEETAYCPHCGAKMDKEEEDT